VAKGQIWSYDLLIATVVFMFTISLIAFFWWSASASMLTKPGDRLAMGAADLADTLLSPGNPSDWPERLNTSDTSTWGAVSIPGITDGFDRQSISVDKASALVQMNDTSYGELKTRLRLSYDFYVEVKEFYNCSSSGMLGSPFNCADRGINQTTAEWNSTEHFVGINGRNFTFGLPPSGARSVSVSNRFAIYNNSIVRMRVMLWTNQTWQ